MVLDCDTYRVNVVSIKALLDDKTDAERLEMIGSVAVITGVPIIVVGCYMGELYGFTDELNTVIDRLMHFYTIKSVLNIKKDGYGKVSS